MLDWVSNIYEGLPEIIKIPVWFVLNIILVRGILASEITTWLKQKGVFKNGILHPIFRALAKEWHLVARKEAIFEHYRLRAQGDGHDNESVVACGQGRCAVL